MIRIQCEACDKWYIELGYLGTYLCPGCQKEREISGKMYEVYQDADATN